MISTSKRGLLAVLGVCVFLIATGCLLLTLVRGKPIFVTTHGISMEPRFHTGDLAVLLPADAYHVGDIVAYHSSALNTVVMHRIVKIENGRYTFKGDNNSWLDPDPATRSQLLGELVLRVPHGGLILQKVRGLAPFLITVILLAGVGTATKQQRRRNGRRGQSRHTRHSARGPDRPSVGARRLSPDLTTAAAITAAAAVFAVFLGIMGLTAPRATAAVKPPAAPTSTPPTSTPPTSTPPTSTAAQTTFSYSAHVGKTPAYDHTTATAPAPIFRKVANLVDLSAAYTGPPGTFTLTADLSTQAGWRSTILLCPATTFTGAGIARTVPVNLNALDERAQAAAAATGIPTDAMGIDVTATVTPKTGDPFTSVLHLTMTQFELSMIGSASALVHRSAPTPASKPTAPTGQRSSTVRLFGWHIPAGTTLAISGLVLAICALSAGAVAVRARWIGQRGESEAIRRRYSALLVPTEPISIPEGRPVVDVSEMATLAKIAEQYGQLVLHWSTDGVETFVVQDESTTYRYRPAPARTTYLSRNRRVHRINIEAGLA